MDINELLCIEETLKIKLPSEYKEVIKNYPFGEEACLIGTRYLLNNKDEVIQ